MFIWDEAKRESNLAKHGLDFADAYLVYENPAKVTLSSTRKEEDRSVDIAFVEKAGSVLTLVYVERDEDVRVVSFRRASGKERELYEQD